MAIAIVKAQLLTDSGIPRSRFENILNIMCGSSATCADLPDDEA